MCVLSKEQQQSEDDTESVATNVDSMTSILVFMNNFARKLRFGDQKNVVLILGNTGSGKTTLTSLLSGVELEAKEVVPGSGEFVIVDEKDLISGKSTTVSKTEIPELMHDVVHKIAYYDCPGFNDSRGVEHDISVSYLIRKLIKFADSVKLVFAISFTSVRYGVGDRRDFMDLAKHAINFAKNIERYRDGIALIVTKVENRYVKGNLVEDDKMIEAIAEFLKQAKIDLENINQQPDISTEDKEFNRKKITFIDILLEKNQKDEYTKIGIMRLADDSGPVKDIELLQVEKTTIFKMINRNLKFVSKENTDFGYTISEETKNRVHDKMEEMQDRLTNDVRSIGHEIYTFYLQQEKHISDLNVLKEKFSIAHQKLSEIESNDPRVFVKLITNVANKLEIGITIDNSNQFWNHMECVDFINAISKINFSNSFNVSVGLDDVKKYLIESRNWYYFLIELHDKLSEYDVQQEKSKIDVSQFLKSISENHETNSYIVELEQLLNGVINLNYSTVENIQLNPFKLRSLETILKQTLNHDPITSELSTERFVAKGHNVKISDIHRIFEEKANPFGVKYIEVFAMNNLFIDADINLIGKKVQLSFIAPTWYVIGDRKINLNGKDGVSHSESKAADWRGGSQFKIYGENGLPGLPGGPAGHFIGIGKKFFNANKLEIHISGGNGSAGQDGGNGRDAQEGKDPEIPKFKSFFGDFDGHKYMPNFTFCKVPPFVGVHYDVDGSDGYKAGKGGNGGFGGHGGHPGQYFIVGFDHRPDLIVSRRKGYRGTHGKGGQGGKESKNGSKVKADFVFAIVGFVNLNKSEQNGMKISSGPNGQDGSCMENLQYAVQPDQFLNPSHTINDYKSYVREYLPNNHFESKLREFLFHFEEDKSIRTKYDTLGLVNDLQGLESQYIRLRDEISFIPFVESLLRRINDRAENKNLSNDDKIVLDFLYAATLTKLSSIKNRCNHTSTIDLHAHTELIQNYIKRLQTAERDEAIANSNNEFKQSLDRKIEMAKYLIDSQISLEIKRNFTEIDKNIHKLIDENIAQQSTIKEQELKNALIRRKIMFWLEVIGPLVMCLGTTAAVVFSCGAVANKFLPKGSASMTSSVKNVALGGGSAVLGQAAKPKIPLSELKPSLLKVKDKLQTGAKTIKKQFDVAENKMREYLGNDTVKEMKRIIRESMKEVHEKIAVKPAETKESKDVQKLGKLTESQEKVMKLEPFNQEVVDNRTDDPDHSTSDVSIVAPSKLRVYNGFSKKSKALLMSLEKQEKNLCEIIIPQLDEIESTLTAMEQNLSNESHVQLDLSKWRIQSVLTEVKAYFNKLTIGFEIEADLMRSIEKLNEAMFVLISVYDRIDSYVEKIVLTSLMAKMATNSHKISNAELNQAISSLRKMIDTNIILEQYESVMYAFRQHVFPFVHLNMTNYWLQPKSIDDHDTNVLVNQAIERITYLEDKLKHGKIKIEKYDQDLIYFKSNTLYTWKNDEIHCEIGKLLEGKEIIIKADIARGIHENAVKFKEIAINFKVHDEKVQTDLNDKLNDFHVVMTMMGNCYYRCGNRSYYVPIDENIVIEYSIQKGEYGKPNTNNEVYRKISDGAYFLSPYTTWSIKLINKNNKDFHDLAKFKNDIIDLQLIGSVQYFKYIKAFSDEFADELLNKHYHFDRIIPYDNNDATILDNV